MFQQPFEQLLSEEITTQIQPWETGDSGGTDEREREMFGVQDERWLPGAWGVCLAVTAAPAQGDSPKGSLYIR